MQFQSDETLEYYDDHWREFVGQTQGVDFSVVQDTFPAGFCSWQGWLMFFLVRIPAAQRDS